MTEVLDTDGIGSGADSTIASQSDSELSRAKISARLKGGVMVVDGNFKVVMIDSRAAGFCGLSSGQSQGKPFYSLFPSLLGSLFATQLHEVETLMGARRGSRPIDNDFLDQFVSACSHHLEENSVLFGISMRAYAEAGSTYGLIQLKLQTALINESTADTASPHRLDQLTNKHRHDFSAAEDAILIVTDCYGYIEAISHSAQELFGYSEQLLKGSSARVLFPGLDGLEGMNITEALPVLSAQHSQGYILAATAEGETKALDAQLFNGADDSDKFILLCRDRTDASRDAEELTNRGHLFDLTTSSVADAVLMLDSEGFVTEMNPIAEQLLGFELDISKAVQIQAVMPLANEDTGISVTPIQDALNKARAVEVTQ